MRYMLKKNSIFILGENFLKLDLVKAFDRYNDDYREDDKLFYLTLNDLIVDPDNFWKEWIEKIDFYKQENDYYLNLIVDLILRKKLKASISFSSIPRYSNRKILNINGTLENIICSNCGKTVDYEVFKYKLKYNNICYDCGGYYKPDIRFFEENYHKNYYKALKLLENVKELYFFSFFAESCIEQDFIRNIDETIFKIYEINNKGIKIFDTSIYIDALAQEYLEKICLI